MDDWWDEDFGRAIDGWGTQCLFSHATVWVVIGYTHPVYWGDF